MLTTILDALAVVLIVAGVALVSIPAALIVFGLLIGFASWQIAGRS